MQSGKSCFRRLVALSVLSSPRPGIDKSPDGLFIISVYCVGWDLKDLLTEDIAQNVGQYKRAFFVAWRIELLVFF